MFHRFCLDSCQLSCYCPTVINETLDEASVSTTLVQSRLVSVSKTTEIPSLAESPSPKPQNFPVLMSLSLDNNIVYESKLPISIKYSFLPAILIWYCSTSYVSYYSPTFLKFMCYPSFLLSLPALICILWIKTSYWDQTFFSSYLPNLILTKFLCFLDFA